MFKKHLKDYFIPHEENKYAPHGLQKAAMIGMLFLVVLSFTATNALSLLWVSSKWMVSTILPAVIVDLTNEERGSQSRTLRRSTVLDEAARMKAEHMANNEYFAHYSPNGVSPWYWFGEVSYNFVHAGENLAIHFSDSSDVVGAWMESPTHRANIMNDNYSEIGVGTAQGSYEGYPTVYVVQLFGTPAAVTVSDTPVAVVPETIQIAQAEIVNDQDSEVLAESVSITEDVEVIEAEPVATEVVEVVPVTTDPYPTTTKATTSNESVIADMEVTDTGVALYSDLISTSTGGIPATIEPAPEEPSNNSPFLFELATQPHKILQIIYITIGTFVMSSLLISIFIEIKRQQPIQIAYGMGLVALMFALVYIHSILSSGALVV